MDGKNIDKRLSALAVCIVGIALLAVCLGEADVLPGGIMPVSYALQVMECLLTLVCVPLALKWMAIKRIREQVAASQRRYLVHSAVRLFLLAVPMLLGAVLYYLMADTSMGYCALIVALALVYIWPSQGRRLRETQTEEEGGKP